jgi:hypothetical protein
VKVSDQVFHLCKVFIDETTVPFDGQNCFIYGALMMPIDCDLSVQLGKARQKANCIDTLHFSKDTKPNKLKDNLIRGFLEAFIESSACFRALLVTPKKWGETKTHSRKARIVGVLLSYPWMTCEDVIYKNFSRPRIIFDRNDMTPSQEKIFGDNLYKILDKKATKVGIKSITKPSFCFSDTRVFDELQLVDLLLGIVRCDYLNKSGQTIISYHRSIRDKFIKNFPKIDSFISADRNKTEQKINVWHSDPK